MVQGMHINWSQLKMMSTTPVLKCGTFQYIDSKKKILHAQHWDSCGETNAI
jgi:hypothetical protein